jgi:hypothetical protein
MAWSAIVSALATRVDAVAGVNNVYQHQRWIKDAAGTDAWRAMFVSGGVMQVWMLSRTRHTSAVCADDDNRYRARHEVEIQAFYAVDDSAATEATFNGLVSAVCANLRTGDRTLGGSCVTHTEPQAEMRYGMFGQGQGVLSHQATIQFTVEEVL